MHLTAPLPTADLPGPDRLGAWRAAAADALSVVEAPTAEEEVWRYSRIGELDTSRYVPAPRAAGAPMGIPVVGELERALGGCAAVVVTRNGWPERIEVGDAWAGRGLAVAPLDADGALWPGALRADATDAVDLLGDALCAVPLAVTVPAGLEVTEPVVVVDWIDHPGALVSARLVVRVGEDAAVSLVEWQGGTDVDALALPTSEIDVARAARLRHVVVQERGLGTWQIARQVAQVADDATLRAALVGLGGDYARNRTDCRLVGRGATAELSAVYFGERDQMLDFRTFQDHLAPDTTSNLLFKGAVGGRSRSVYTGLIHVGRDARGTNARQTNRNIKLSEHAWAESVPNLEIENNDVRCSHASAVGPVDEEQRFYLESRGVPTEDAERLIVGGFFAEVTDGFPVPTVAPLVAERLAGRVGVAV